MKGDSVRMLGNMGALLALHAAPVWAYTLAVEGPWLVRLFVAGVPLHIGAIETLVCESVRSKRIES
jgi:hypothetical protein